MPIVTFVDQDNVSQIAAKHGATILEIARSAALLLESPCAGNGSCGKCRVELLDAQSIHNIVVSNQSSPLAGNGNVPNVTLACQAKVIGDIRVSIVKHLDVQDIQIVNHGQAIAIEPDPFIQKKYNPSAEITEVFAGDESIGVERGNTADWNYGLIVDIGTTTLVVSLYDLNADKELGTVSALNPQCLYAQDVLSRIHIASDEEGLQLMYSSLVGVLNQMIGTVCKKSNIVPEQIYEAVYSGNTCMIHLATRTSPRSLGRYPYAPAIRGGLSLNSLNFDLEISPFGQIYLPPVISGYVGADIASGIVAANLHTKGTTVLFIDIGTNGEVVLVQDGVLMAASTAAGPAFEGMNISCGMRAAPGAIEGFYVELTGQSRIKTIDNQPAIGICGSGLIDIVGELVVHGVIQQNGRFIQGDRENLAAKLQSLEGKVVYRIVDQVYLSQQDVRQVQLAKGAIRAGIEALLNKAQVKAECIDKVLIAGSFGYHVSERSLINIGLLPSDFSKKIAFLGNTSKMGGQVFLRNKGTREMMRHIASQVTVVELSMEKGFDKLFIDCLAF